MADLNHISNKDLLQEIETRFEKTEKSLEKQIAMTEQLMKLNTKLEESENLKSHFLSNIRNEIINPFSSIIGLSRHIVKVNKEDWKKVVSIAALIHSEAFYLDFQLRNIFAAAELEAGDSMPQISHVDISSVIDSLTESFHHLAKEKSIKVLFNNLLPLNEKNTFHFKTDPDKLQIILSNLLSNAIQFSNENSAIDITASINNKMLFVSIKDYGIGIKEENQTSIFDRFKRINTQVNNYNKGYGLGLSICKEMAELLSGHIVLKSKENEGSEFVLVLAESDVETDSVSGNSNEIMFDDVQMF